MNWTKTDYGYRAETPHGIYEAHRTKSGKFVFKAAGEADSKPGTLAQVKEWAGLVDANRAALAADPRGTTLPVEVVEDPYGHVEPECTGVRGPELAFCEDLSCPRHGERNRTDEVFWPRSGPTDDPKPDDTWNLPAEAEPDPNTVSTVDAPTVPDAAPSAPAPDGPAGFAGHPPSEPAPGDDEPHEEPLPADEGDPPGEPVGVWETLFPPAGVPRDRRGRPVTAWLAAA